MGREDPVLPGEDPRSTDAADVEHWIAVYRELVEGLRAAWRDGGDETDPLLRHASVRYERRLRYWRERRRWSEPRGASGGAGS